MADDLRQRYIEAIGACERPTMEDLADAVMAVRDEQIEQLRYERRLLGAARMVLDLVAAGDPSRWEQARQGAEDLAQRIVDEIGHPVTDEPALGPGFRAEIAVRDEELERLRSTANTDSRINLQLREEITRLRINAERDVCSGCMQREEQRDRWMEACRQIGVKYEAAKQRWYEAQDRAEDAEAVNARARTAHPSREEAEAARQVLCPECAQPAPCKTRRVLDDPHDAGRG